MILLNKCEYGCSGVDWILESLSKIEIKKILYHIPLTSKSSATNYVNEVKKFVDTKIPNIDGIIIDCTAEAPEIARFQELIDVLTSAGYSKNQILCVDSSIDFNTELNNIIMPNWINVCKDLSNVQKIQPLENRSTLFLVLARIPKYHRVKFIIELIKKNLDQVTLITCGSNLTQEGINDHILFDQIVPLEFRNRFPITLDADRVDRHTGSMMIDDRFTKCLINVIIESGFENDLYGCSGPPSHSWNRLFYTEKTDKCFHMGQIPIFVAKKGYAQTLRNVYNFDIFDDIVDHSYDSIEDPMARIHAVAQECERLSKIGLDSLKLTDNLINRLNYNKNQVSAVKEQLLKQSFDIFKNWIRNL